MSRPTLGRERVAGAAMMAVTFALGLGLAVFVSGAATAASSKSTTAKKSTTTTTEKKKTTTPSGQTTDQLTTATGPQGPADQFFVINGTVFAASDHEIVGSSAFPNFATGAVDNYYALAHSHVDNSPFAQGTASPADTGPIGQTAAAGNTQQPQYADARWPGGPDKASYGNQGGPYATAAASEYNAVAEASEATNGFAGPGPTGKLTLALPLGFDARLQQVLAAWRATWEPRLGGAKQPPTVTPPAVPAAPPKPGVPTPTKPTVTVPKAPIAPPAAPVPSVAPTVTTPQVADGSTSSSPSAPSLTVSTPSTPPLGPPGPPRSLTGSSSGDGEWLLTSSTLAALVPSSEAAKADASTAADAAATDTTKTDTTKTDTTKTDTSKSGPAPKSTLVTSGESSLGRVSIAGGQIVIRGIHVTASIANDGTPSYKANVSIASATIGGVPVTIDQDGVHVAGQGQALPYQQASDALNGALKQAGIRLFLVGPEVKTCGQSGGGGGGTGGGSTSPTTTSSTTTTPTSTTGDQSGTTSSCDQSGSSGSCQSGPGGGGVPIGGSTTTTSTTTTSTNQSGSNTTTTPCDQSGSSGSCSQPGTGGGGVPPIGGSTTTTTTPSRTQPGTTTTSSTTTTPCGQTGATCDQAGSSTGGSTTTGTTTTAPSRTTTSSRNQPTSTTTTSTTPSSCGTSGTMPTLGGCQPGASPGATTPPGASPGATTPPGMPMSGDALNPMNPGGGASSTEMTVTATGLHVVFTQPVSPPGVPAQYVEHILGEVFVDSLAVPAPPVSAIDLSSSLAASAGPAGSSKSCLGARSSGKATSGTSAVGGSSTGGTGSSLAGGSAATGALGAGGSALGAASGSSSGSGAAGGSLPAQFAAALRKPVWLLLAYVIWQVLVIGTGASLWNWRRGDPA